MPDVTTKLYDSVGFAVMPQLPGNLELLKIAQEVAEESGFPVPGPKLCGGGSDAAYTEAAGVPTLCGTGVEGSRTTIRSKNGPMWTASSAALSRWQAFFSS